MYTEIIYMDMPESIKAFSVKSADNTCTIIINKKWNKGSEIKTIKEHLIDK